MREKIFNWLQEYIKDYQYRKDTVTSWEEPLVAFAAAGDPLFLKLKELVSPDHLLPQDLLTKANTVIAYYVPLAPEINRSNKGKRESSPQWAQAYVETNSLIKDINEYLKKKLAKESYQAMDVPPTHNFDQQTLLSRWSHKHVGYIAGLGTFGLNHLLITSKGCNGRLGSIVTDLVLEPTPRPEYEYCLAKYNGSCGSCLKSCPQDALLAGQEYDRHKCYNLCLENAARYQSIGLADVCGKCCSEVPCSFIAPSSLLQKRKGDC